METREALTLALTTYEGALLLVSHDRHLLRAAAESLWLVHDGRLASFDGDLDDYAALVLASRREGSEQAAETGASRKEQRRADAQQRQRLAQTRKPLQAELAKLEKELARVTTEVRELDARLADADFYTSGDPDEVATTIRRRGELASRVETIETRWLELTEALETIQ